jgi:toxin CptA
MDLNALEARLENWALAQRSGGFSGPDIGSVEGRYRGRYADEPEADPDIDAEDAFKVNEAWKRCMPLDRDLLKMYYVWRASAAFICRRLKLKQGRQYPHVWDFALYHAQNSIDSQLKKADGLVNPIKSSYTARRLPIPA